MTLVLDTVSGGMMIKCFHNKSKIGQNELTTVEAAVAQQGGTHVSPLSAWLEKTPVSLQGQCSCFLCLGGSHPGCFVGFSGG